MIAPPLNLGACVPKTLFVGIFALIAHSPVNTRPSVATVLPAGSNSSVFREAMYNPKTPKPS
ncbi:MAG TPA: hypothetical protein VFI44_06410, partial [Ornithinibacter sp.]|nr:hypothetical protein [Ornithinibacter sp.]